VGDTYCPRCDSEDCKCGFLERLSGHSLTVETAAEPDVFSFLQEGDTTYDWLIPGVLERGDRMILTAREGEGKSIWLSQLGVQAASGIQPFEADNIQPVRVAIVDCENPTGELRRRMAKLVALAGNRLLMHQLFVYSRPAGLDLAGTGEDHEWLRDCLVRSRAELLILGPIYKLGSGDPEKEVDTKPIATFIDELRAELEITVALEGHMTHEGGGRPFGWSGWRRWPDIGIELRSSGALTAWRPARHETPALPHAVTRDGMWLWNATHRARDELWSRIVEHSEPLLSTPTVRELVDKFGYSVGSIQKCLDEHRGDWEALKDRKKR
jgi:hypothetical protein